MSAAACGQRSASNFEIDKWQGRLLSGEPIHLSDLPVKKLILNVYSPTCQPCIEELPALHVVYEEAKRRGNPLYMIIDNRIEAHGLVSMPGRDDFHVLKKRLEEDIERYNITIPFIIMNDSFRVSPENGLITGTPETMIFSTNPLYLEYNFIGPVGMSGNPEELRNDSRFQFILNKI